MSDIFRDYSFGGWLRHFRLEKGISLREFAKITKMDVGNLSRLENSETPPPKKAEKIFQLCHALGKPDAVHVLKSIAFQHHLAMLHKEFFGENEKVSDE